MEVIVNILGWFCIAERAFKKVPANFSALSQMKATAYGNESQMGFRYATRLDSDPNINRQSLTLRRR